MNMQTFTRLYQAGTSFYTLKKGVWQDRPVWWLVLVAPRAEGFRQITYRCAAFNTRDDAISTGQNFATEKRPFKVEGTA